MEYPIGIIYFLTEITKISKYKSIVVKIKALTLNFCKLFSPTTENLCKAYLAK